MTTRSTGRYERTTSAGEEAAAFVPSPLPPADTRNDDLGSKPFEQVQPADASNRMRGEALMTHASLTIDLFLQFLERDLTTGICR